MTSADHAPARRDDREPPPPFPTLRKAEAYRIRFRRARRFVVAGKEASFEEATAVDVHTEGELPAMGVGLALFIGNAVLVESERLEKNRYRFYAPPGLAWKSGAALSLGLAGSGLPTPVSRSTLKLAPIDEREAPRPE